MRIAVSARPIALLVAILFACAVVADESAPATITVRPLTRGIALVTGEVGNVVVGYGADSVVVVDTGSTDLAPRLKTAIAQVDARPVKFVINTSWHADHAGGNAEFAGAGANVVGQLNTQRRIAEKSSDASGQSPHSVSLPTHTYLDVRTIAAGGDMLRLVHVQRAHTDGDTIVKWTRGNVLHMGDVYVRYGLPFIDLESGGSLAGMIDAVETALTMCDDRTVIIPGHGEPARRQDLADYRDRLQRIAIAVQGQLQQGKSLAEVQALRLADAWPQTADARVQPDEFIAMACASYGSSGSMPRDSTR